MPSEIVTNEPDYQQDGSFWKDVIAQQHEQGSAQMVSDSYAETTISTEGALYILNEAQNIHRPTGFADSGISLLALKDFLRQNGQDIAAFLGSPEG